MAETKIGNRAFKVQPMLATKALVLQGRLLKAFGPAASKLGEMLKSRGDDVPEEQREAAQAAALAALGEVLTRLDPYEYASLVSDIVAVSQIQRGNGQYMAADLDGDFSENPEDIIPVVLFVLRTQFGSFFKGLPGLGNLGALARG
ncbi:putative structural protein [Rhizobium phage RHph_N17]|nr:putative structural protein [Rhizobium phage RHph_N17]